MNLDAVIRVHRRSAFENNFAGILPRRIDVPHWVVPREPIEKPALGLAWALAILRRIRRKKMSKQVRVVPGLSVIEVTFLVALQTVERDTLIGILVREPSPAASIMSPRTGMKSAES